MPTEKFDTLLPRPGSGKRILKSKLLTALGATGVLLPYPQNTERLIERKILLQKPFSIGGGLDPVWLGLNAYWKLEEATGTLRLDSTGNGNHLTDTSANITQAVGLIGECGTSAGGSQCLEIPDNAFVGAGPGVSFSLSIWVKTSGTANAVIAGKWASNDNVLGQAVMDWRIYCNSGNNLACSLHVPGAFDDGILFGGVLNNTWQHLVLTFQAGTHVCNRYLNGAFVGTTTEIADVQRGTGAFALFNYATVHSLGITGSMDETGLWNRALSATEVTHLYNGGAGLAYPGTVAPLTMGAAWAVRVGFNGGAAPSAATVSALDTFWNGLVSDAIDIKVVVFNAFAPDSLIALLTPFIQGPGLGLWTNHNFLLADLSINGLVGDGSTKYLTTGIAPNAAGTASSIGMFIIVSADNSVGTQEDMGCNDAATHSFTLSPHFGAGANHQFACWSFSAEGTDVLNNWVPPSPATGYYSGQRTANNAIAVYFANSTTPHAALETGSGVQVNTAIATTINVFSDNVNGTPSNFSRKTISVAGVTVGLSSADDAKLQARLYTLRQALGGGNP